MRERSLRVFGSKAHSAAASSSTKASPPIKTGPPEARKEAASAWFRLLRDRLCAAFEEIEADLAGRGAELGAHPAPGRFVRTAWERTPDASSGAPSLGSGGGVMSLMHGRVFEKVGVNFSEMMGEFAPEFARQVRGAHDDPRFWACGISVVAHARSPLVPAAHFNTRHIVTTAGWFGGGGDLTPTYPNEADTRAFHEGLQAACDRTDHEYYPRFKRWCDEYFYLPHRKEPRGIGGIFFDSLDTGDWERDFAFVRDVGEAFLSTYPKIVRTHMDEPWTAEQREHQLVRRGRYVEFNLLYDRGTQFGLKTGGNPEAILMSLPPEVKWP